MRRYRLAFYELFLQDEVLYDQHGELFDSQFFSKFKYGSSLAAHTYGNLLFELIQLKLPFLVEDTNLTISASPYKFVPPASHAIAQAILERWKVFSSFTLPIYTKIGRNKLFPSDYSRLDRESRNQLMQKIELHWIQPPHQHSPRIVIIDDIYITGAHEERLAEFLEKEGFAEVYFIYSAQLISKAHPTIEHQINHFAVKNIWDLAHIWYNEGFILNARICKFLLNYSDTHEILQFSEALPESWAREIAEGMLKDGYHQMHNYLKNWEIWERYAPLLA